MVLQFQLKIFAGEEQSGGANSAIIAGAVIPLTH
jgi:hypothetical protein